jgi:hypothetical protein
MAAIIVSVLLAGVPKLSVLTSTQRITGALLVVYSITGRSKTSLTGFAYFSRSYKISWRLMTAGAQSFLALKSVLPANSGSPSSR